MSHDGDDLKGWYNHLWRDGYHTFKLILELLMFSVLMIYNLDWIYGLAVWILVQIVYDLFIEYLLKRAAG